MNPSPKPPPAPNGQAADWPIRLRPLASLVAIGCGAGALLIAIQLLRSVLG
jgi:hypothetical protein